MNPVDFTIKKLGEMPRHKRIKTNIVLITLPLLVIVPRYMGLYIPDILNLLTLIYQAFMFVVYLEIIFKYGGWWWTDEGN